ncbi:hypothetical protein [Halochromatium sp.]
MLETLSALANRLRPLTRPLVVVLVMLLIGSAISVFMRDVSILQTALPALVTLMLWVICALVFILAFVKIPARPSADVHGLQRLSRQLNRGFHWLLLGLFALITVAAILISSRLLVEL